MIVTFDEHGGTYDHVAPPWTAVAPDEVSESGGAMGFRFNRFGVRVPTILVSPYVQAGTVFRSEGPVPFDHTSLIKTVLLWRGIDPTAGLGKRVPLAPTFEMCLTSTPGSEMPALPEGTPDQEVQTGGDAPLTGLHAEKVRLLVDSLAGESASNDEKVALASDLKKSQTVRELRETAEEYLPTHGQSGTARSRLKGTRGPRVSSTDRAPATRSSGTDCALAVPRAGRSPTP